MRKTVTLCEVAPRDGWQNLPAILPLEDKLGYIEDILASGVRRLQLGAFVSPKAVAQMRDTGVIARALVPKYPHHELFALVPNLYGAEAAVQAGLKEISYVISVSESHNRANLNRTVAQSLEELGRIRCAFPNLKIGLDAATAFGCPFEGEVSADRLLDLLGRADGLGVDGFNLCDTIGVACPHQIVDAVEVVQRHFPRRMLEVHIHDTRNLGILNTWTAIQCGVERVQTSLGGLGGCPFAPGASGNTATEDLVYLLDRSGYETGIDFEKLLDVARRMHGQVPGNYSGHQVAIGSPCAPARV